MKIKPRYLILVIVLFVVAVSSILFFHPGSMASLFSQSVNTPEVDTGRPAVQSLDNQIPSDTSIDRTQEIKDLQQELLNAQNDPEKDMEIRRRLQILQAAVQQ